MKHELLVPVGTYASLIAAINNGADAVYLAGKKFGARAYADNFSDEELEKAIKLCHLYDVKVYITVNTLIFENEIDEVLKYVGFIHSLGVDAVIMQDVGMINLVHNTYPNLEIHASTQMHTHSKGSLKFLKDLGIKRVVFAREMSLEEIDEIDTDIEKEAFIHGALCVSYSGQCLFSSCILKRSGNRGSCAGMCRLPYKILENNKEIKTEGDYLLSPKDLCSISYFEKLLKSNIKSFKIEGRMKSPAYVGIVTKIYRTLIDQYERGEKLYVKEDDLNLLKSLFNREFTKGFLGNDNDIMNILSPNHIGIRLGRVINITNKKIKIKLERELYQFEGIRFKESNKGMIINFLYDEKDNLINHAQKNDIVLLDNNVGLTSLDEVLLTTPKTKEEDTITKKININMVCECKVGKPLRLMVKDNKNTIIKEETIIELAKNAEVSVERIKESLEKIGNTAFVVNDLKIIKDDNIFVPMSILNNLRRDVLEMLKEKRENVKNEIVTCEYIHEIFIKEDNLKLNVLVRTDDQLKACKELGIKNIIVENPNLMEENFIFKVPRGSKSLNYNYQNLLITDYASLSKYPGNILDYHLNVTNNESFNYLSKFAKSIMLSVELNDDQIKDIMSLHKKMVNAEILIYGRIELMLMKYCPLNKLVNKNKVCNVCQNQNKYYLKDRNNKLYPLLNNVLTHNTAILNHEITNKIDNIEFYKNLGISNFRIEFFDETYEETLEILKECKFTVNV